MTTGNISACTSMMATLVGGSFGLLFVRAPRDREAESGSEQKSCLLRQIRNQFILHYSTRPFIASGRPLRSPPRLHGGHRLVLGKTGFVLIAALMPLRLRQAFDNAARALRDRFET
ncbi:hypothetical protein [Agrobacterium larrymoorei]|uniref:Uncharacterized protein n=1 Tax=Agrobacterium larrymoorei TaxID=160699 RepID=A0A4D7E180_9HYPH|nr:hypothetical protein [Agrobacterium larrymoorei]QCJ01040.1 hypothetical protein CFBP5473_24085 [Agrobacterium larrymoorei]QYA10375.1 hypothetical protein J5285_22740 [Agrobacterium larrymoorei]